MKLKHTILFLALLLPLIGMGQGVQTFSKRDSVQYSSPYRDLRAFPCTRQANYYLNPEGQTRYQGEMRIHGKDNLKSGYRNDSQQYDEIRNYYEGMLNGKFTQSYSHNGNGTYGGNYTIHQAWSLVGNFESGQPHGTWKFDLTSKLTSSSERENIHRTETAVYEHGHLASITDRNGQKLTFDQAGLISGTDQLKEGGKVELKHGIVCNTYQNRLGDVLTSGTIQREIINEIISQQGDYNNFNLIDRGYAIDWQEAFLTHYSRYAEHLDRYAQIEQVAPNFPMPSYSVRIGRLREIQKASDSEAIEYFIQRQEEFAELMRNGYFVKRNSKRYFGESAASKIRELWLETQQEMLAKKLNLLINLTADSRWNESIIDCRTGSSALPDLFAWKWSNRNMTSEEAYNEVADLIDKKLGSLHPIVGFEIKNAQCTPQANMEVDCIIHKGNLDSVGYESIQLKLTTNSEGYILLDRFEPAQYQRLNNTWDTIYQLEDSIKHQHLEVRKLLYSAQYLDFKEYCESVLADKSILPEVRLADLRELQQLQAETKRIAPVLNEISRKNNSIQARLHQFKYMLHLYNNYYENIDPSWDSHMDDLQSVLEHQQRILKSKKKSQFGKIERTLKRTRATSIKELMELL